MLFEAEDKELTNNNIRLQSEDSSCILRECFIRSFYCLHQISKNFGIVCLRVQGPMLMGALAGELVADQVQSECWPATHNDCIADSCPSPVLILTSDSTG